ncbi:PREDICTED: uncharacterized serine-rich protein C1E8.05-like [Nicotiana attenuata]|uniref:uncharacterized serine-rich protein C1E8.05-like n=1 Tax=Nicotiana attenuata TaxID=49451 RepID=UPI0009055A83|nr:PREDICTED: uncharacterized serine-rich protein C1E8.05-like [Nicotiana attenuata]
MYLQGSRLEPLYKKGTNENLIYRQGYLTGRSSLRCVPSTAWPSTPKTSTASSPSGTSPSSSSSSELLVESLAEPSSEESRVADPSSRAFTLSISVEKSKPPAYTSSRAYLRDLNRACSTARDSLSSASSDTFLARAFAATTSFWYEVMSAAASDLAANSSATYSA